VQSLAFWKAVAMDRGNFLDDLVALLEQHEIRYCVIGGQGVNAYADPLVSLDLDLVVAVDQIPGLERLLSDHYKIEKFPHSINVSAPDSNLRVQIQTVPRYAEFLDRAVDREVLGLPLRVAAVEDVLTGKIWAAQDPGRRASKRHKDLLDIERLIEAHPELRSHVPASILSRISDSD
jgi:hypothetical protein